MPLDGKSNLLLRYRGKKRTFPYLSAADVLSGQVPADAVRGKIVFVGTTALGTREVVATPLDTLFAGVEVQATVADNLLRAGLHPPLAARDDCSKAWWSLVLGLAMARARRAHGRRSPACSARPRRRRRSGGEPAWLLSTRGLFISPLSPTLGVVAALAVMTLAKFTVERRRADRPAARRPTRSA